MRHAAVRNMRRLRRSLLGKVSLFFGFDSKRADAFREVRQTVAVEPGSRYRLSAFYKTELRAADDVAMHLVVTSAATSAAIAASRSFALNAEWAEASAEFEVPSDTDGIVIRLVRDDCRSPICPLSGKLWLDDVTLTKE